MKTRAAIALAIGVGACGPHEPAPSSPRDAKPAPRAPDARAPDAKADTRKWDGPIALPGGDAGIGFDDLGYAPELHAVLAPAGRTGQVDLIDVATGAITSIGGFSASDAYGGGHGEGTTSASAGGGKLYASDRDAAEVAVVDVAQKKIVARARLAGTPDYVRWVEPSREIWVTEPGKKQIEVFSSDDPPKSLATIAIAGGPESLIVSTSRKRAYTHTWKDETIAIDIATRKPVARWKNGCKGSRGIALDDARGWLFVGCDEGKAVALDLDHDGKVLGTAATGAGVDIIAYSPTHRRLYVPGEDAATTTVIAVGDDGALKSLGTVPAAKGSHCATTDDAGHVWVCDPAGGRLLAFTDSF